MVGSRRFLRLRESSMFGGRRKRRMFRLVEIGDFVDVAIRWRNVVHFFAHECLHRLSRSSRFLDGELRTGDRLEHLRALRDVPGFRLGRPMHGLRLGGRFGRINGSGA